MAYDKKKAKNEIAERLTKDAEYFPFEWIREYKHLKAQKEHGVDFWPSFESDYASFFADVKKECERLIAKEPNSPNMPLWKEAIQELDAITK